MAGAAPARRRPVAPRSRVVAVPLVGGVGATRRSRAASAGHPWCATRPPGSEPEVPATGRSPIPDDSAPVGRAVKNERTFMDAVLFGLVNSEDSREVYAWGMELSYEEPETETERRVATVFVPGVHGEKDFHSVHSSAENARDTYTGYFPSTSKWNGRHRSVPNEVDQRRRRRGAARPTSIGCRRRTGTPHPCRVAARTVDQTGQGNSRNTHRQLRDRPRNKIGTGSSRRDRDALPSVPDLLAQLATYRTTSTERA